MELELISADQMSSGKGSSGKGKGRYTKYIAAYQKIVPELKGAIEQSDDGYIRVKTSELAKNLGKEYTKLHPTSIQWGSKYALFHEGIVVTTGKHKGGNPVLVMRIATPDDKLPKSLAKGEEPVEGEEDNGTDGNETGAEAEDDENGGEVEEDK